MFSTIVSLQSKFVTYIQILLLGDPLRTKINFRRCKDAARKNVYNCGRGLDLPCSNINMRPDLIQICLSYDNVQNLIVFRVVQILRVLVTSYLPILKFVTI